MTGCSLTTVRWVLVSLAVGLIAGVAQAGEQEQEKTPAQTYEEHASRAHPDRYPNELTDAQWETVMLHMRARAPMTARDHRRILKYLQENN